MNRVLFDPSPLGKTVLAAAVSVLCLIPPAGAQEAALTPVKSDIIDVGASARVDYSGRLRMLSQKVAANACQFAFRPGDPSHKDLLIDAIAQYEKFVLALRDGNDEIGIFGPEPSAITIRKIDALLTIWQPYRLAAEAVAQGTEIEQNLSYIAANNQGLLQAAIEFASHINATYSNPAELTQANAMVLDIAGRQRTLTQKMSKEACGIESGNPAFGTAEDLLKTAALFDVSINALSTGMPDAGVMPPPTPEIGAALQVVIADWATIKVDIETFAATGPADPGGAETDLYDRFEVLLDSMIRIVEQYRDFAILKI